MTNTNLPVVINADIKTGFAGGVEISLLGYNITGVVEKDTSGATRVLVMTKEGKRQTQTINEIIGKLNSTFKANIDQASVNNVLGYVGLSANETTINLNQAFLLYISNADPNKTEYAFSLSINNEPKTPTEGKGLETGDFFEIKTISFSVWNTKRQSILKKMGIGSIQQLLTMLEEDDE